MIREVLGTIEKFCYYLGSHDTGLTYHLPVYHKQIRIKHFETSVNACDSMNVVMGHECRDGTLTFPLAVIVHT